MDDLVVVAQGVECGQISRLAIRESGCDRSDLGSGGVTLRPRGSHRRRRGFTLIELLVVIAIIALLIAILLPSLEAARRQAKQSACLSHIKNIATSSRVYESGDSSGFGIPIHPLQYAQDAADPTFIGAYEWGGKSGIGRNAYVGQYAGTVLGSKYGTAAGFGPATRPMNEILYRGGFVDHGRVREYENLPAERNFNRVGATQDTALELDLFKCPADDGPPRGAHCPDWLANTERSSYDHFGNSYAANVFMICCPAGSSDQPGFMQREMGSNSPYLRPISRVPTPSRTLYYEENIGRWAWSCRRERCDGSQNGMTLRGVDPGPTKAVRGWHGRDWTFNRAFVDAHAESQRIYEEGTEDEDGYVFHYRIEHVHENEELNRASACVVIRGNGWQKDTLPAPFIRTGLLHSAGERPSYEDCVRPDTG